ncbi:MAG TPA: ABC transporter ATP-binding protein, partial [Oceanospirillaceae bacterium]|nr:ABC transporter ATP-binding protein [Oceanospirillaceae bacterium]
VQEIERMLQKVKEQGITTIIVEQNAMAALKLADKAIIIDTGEIVFTGTAEEVMANQALREEYLAV